MTDIYSDLLPFGAQYYRAPTPLECDWENDLAAMEAAGFNLIKIWAVWRSNNPVDGVYDFSDLDGVIVCTDGLVNPYQSLGNFRV